MARYDMIVAGLGAMGSAALYHAARRGARVLGLEQFDLAHALGSSHGHSRIIRQAYFEGEGYVPLVLRAYELWRALERDSETHLMTLTGGLTLGPADSAAVTGAARAARVHGIRHEVLGGAEIHRRFPLFTPPDGDAGVLEPEAGFLDPEACITAHATMAVRLGAEARFGTGLADWRALPGGGVEARLADGTVASADHLVLTLGAYAPEQVDPALFPIRVERQVSFWFAPRVPALEAGTDRCPVYIWELADGLAFYGFPAADARGAKAGMHHGGDATTARAIDRAVRCRDETALRAAMEPRLGGLCGPRLDARVCMYANSPDQNFLIDRHPESPDVWVAAGFSGHGFKFSAAVGEALAAWALADDLPEAIAPFARRRLTESPAG